MTQTVTLPAGAYLVAASAQGRPLAGSDELALVVTTADGPISPPPLFGETPIPTPHTSSSRSATN